jgi:hypothetical protein
MRSLRMGSSNRNDPCGRTVLMCALEDHTLRDDEDRPGAKHEFLTMILNTQGEIEERMRKSINQRDREVSGVRCRRQDNSCDSTVTQTTHLLLMLLLYSARLRLHSPTLRHQVQRSCAHCGAHAAARR